MFFEINAFGSDMKWYPINLIFYMIDLLDEPDKMNGSDYRCGPGIGPKKAELHRTAEGANCREAPSIIKIDVC